MAEEGDAAAFDRLVATDEEYLVFCGVISLGRLIAEGAGAETEERLRRHATDGRWRVREAVAMALQRLGDADLPRLLDLVAAWANASHPLVQRAAVAGVREPRLLRSPDTAAAALDACEHATRALAARPAVERPEPGVRALRQGLGYCWSVAVAADPAAGLSRFRALARVADRDVAWIVRANSRKARLAKLL